MLTGMSRAFTWSQQWDHLVVAVQWFLHACRVRQTIFASLLVVVLCGPSWSTCSLLQPCRISNKNSHKMSQDIRHETASQTNYQGQSFRQSNKAHFYDVGKLLGLNISTQMMGKPYSVAVASDRKVAKGKKQVPPMTVSWYRRKRRKESYMSYMLVCVCVWICISVVHGPDQSRCKIWLLCTARQQAQRLREWRCQSLVWALDHDHHQYLHASDWWLLGTGPVDLE